MESGNLDGQQSEDLMRPPHAVRSKRKRGCSKDEADKGNPPKKLCTEGTAVKVGSDTISLAESSFINDLKKESNFTDGGDLKTSTPNGAENLPQKRRTRGSMSGVDTSASTCLSPLDVSCASEKSQAEETSVDDKSMELSGVTDDSRPLERSSRRTKSTSARVLLGLEKRKEMAGQPKDRKERSTEVTMTSADRSKTKGMTGPKVKKEVLPKVQHEVLSSSLEGLPDTPTSLSVERCTVVKPDWLKPFKLGWRREIVFRNTLKSPSSTKALCDVYYFSSDDTKLRSLPQILEYLKSVKSTLTAECFTFTKSAIYKEPQEMVRAAAFSRGRISRTGLLSSNESSMKSFDDTNEDASSQASSTGTNRQRKVKETLLASYDPIKADVSVKTEPSVIDVTPETPIIIAPINLDIKTEEPSPPDPIVVAPVDETDKRQAVRAAATLALRTYMSHALRTVNNPLLQSGSVKPPPEKEKAVLLKSPAKTKTASVVQGKHQLPRKSLSPVVNIKRLNPNKVLSDVSKRSQPEENVRRRKGPPSAMNLAKLNVKRSDESYGKSQEPMTSKVTKLKARSLMSTAAAVTPKPGLAEKSVRDLRKMSPLKKSTPKLSDAAAASPSGVATSFEKINAAIKALMSKKDGQPSSSVKKLSKNCPTVIPLPVKTMSKTKTLTTLPSPVVKILPKPDGKSNEKPALSVERKPSVTPTAVVLKPIERCLIETSRICGMDCPGRLGIPPTLPCATCMCLFHPECAGYTSHMYFTPEMNFTCWACGKLNKELETTSYGLYKRDNQTTETSSSEASSRNLKKQSAVGKSTSNGGNLADDVNAIAQSSQRVQHASNDGASAAAAAAAGLEHLNVLHPSTSLSAIFTEEVTVSCGPSAQLLVIPAALARHLNMSHPLTLLVDDREVHVKPEQLKVSGVGLNITLPMGSVPDAFVEGPEKPLEFRVVSTAESGRQAVAVSLFERPTRKSSALEAFSTRKADRTAAPLVDSAGQSDSVIAVLDESSIVSITATDFIKHGQDEGNLKSNSGQTSEGSAKPDESLTTGNTTEDMDMKEDESKPAISSKAISGKKADTDNENMVPEIELSMARAADETPTETNLSTSSETGKDVMETSMEKPKAEVSMETECSIPIREPPVDSSTDKMNVPHERSEEEETTNEKSPIACSTTDEKKEGTKERETTAVVCNSSAASFDESHERDGTVALEGNELESSEPNDEIDSSIKTDV